MLPAHKDVQLHPRQVVLVHTLHVKAFDLNRAITNTTEGTHVQRQEIKSLPGMKALKHALKIHQLAIQEQPSMNLFLSEFCS